MKRLVIIVLVLISVISLGQDVIKKCQIKMPCTLQEKPIPGTGSIKIQKGDSVDVIDIVMGGYYKVKFKGNLGYVNDLFIYDPDLIQMAKNIRNNELSREGNDINKYKSSRKFILVQKYGQDWADLIVRNSVCIGMNKAAAIESWGKPDDINKTTSSIGVQEQWVYKGKNYDNKYLYFENGVLTTIQE